ncbi:Asp-tRNA(Asn)/Glu-tRNA(Gln) amidotransferase subunit GatC [Mycoplasma sp. Mirounga ES2805-ORL]|uniref:Asp-tRNA(Asn)/Glu-tRNA(Gln) amidotransferase subunit GatC n=1 Tax=Mycoplasma sp. Mirounga ES2805-ORL TaxID=754514 RepID=UPI00197B913E|nr:Asp-tRNA(Asn)/Glu-tRNA(Gln) amidotransferase subunit GatC [Mycoplasma sp. Mirounga ES2805-ORL]QSF13651.1 aspartyl/glutamyl-tRNA amidotransferase subunit C [Mycoplasma sp. Mirounga ES2805-ORL]
MKKITDEFIKTLASSLMFEPSKKVLFEINKEWGRLVKDFERLKMYDTDGVKPLTHIDENLYVDFLREDIVDENFNLDKQKELDNAKKRDDNYIIIEQVVK